MATFKEDEEPRVTLLEQRMVRGVPSFPHVNALLSKLMVNILTEPTKAASARAIVVAGARSEPGAAWFGLLQPKTLNVRFRSKRNVLDLDAILKPFYGNVMPGLAEMRGTAIDEALEEYWLEWFRTDSGVYRVYVTCSMCVAAATEELRR